MNPSRVRLGRGAGIAWWATVAPALSPEAAARADAADRESAVSLSELESEFSD